MSSTGTHTHAQRVAPTVLRSRTAIAAVLAATVLVVLDTAMVNIALPTIVRSLQVAPAQSVWIITASQVAVVMALFPCAALGESLGYRRVFTGGVALFTGASALCALSPTLPLLIAARVIQGLGSAAVMALGIALLRTVVADQQLGAAIGWNALAVALSAAAGPALGAAILAGGDWPWLFAVNLPLGVLVLLATRALPDVRGTARRLDLRSVTLNAATFALFVIGAELLSARPRLAAGLLAVAAVVLLALVRRELPKEAPLIPLDLLRAAPLRISVIASVCCFAGVAASLVSLPFYLQQGLAQDAWTTGLCMTPWPLAVALAAPLAGRLANRVSTAWLCTAGGVCLAVGLAGLALFQPQRYPLQIVMLMVLCGFGFGLFQVSNNRNMLLAAPRARSGAAGGMQGTARLAGQTAGTIIMTQLFTLTSSDAAPRIGLLIAAALTLAAGIVSASRGRAFDRRHRRSRRWREVTAWIKNRLPDAMAFTRTVEISKSIERVGTGQGIASVTALVETSMIGCISPALAPRSRLCRSHAAPSVRECPATSLRAGRARRRNH